MGEDDGEVDPVEKVVDSVPVEILTAIHKEETDYAYGVAKRYARTGTQVSAQVVQLEKAGFVVRDEENGRRKTLSLTEKGRRVAESFVAVQEELADSD